MPKITENLKIGSENFLGTLGKLLNALIENLKWIVIGLGLIIASSIATKCSGDKKYQAYKAHADSVATQYVDSIEHLNQIHLAKADSQKHIADSLTARIRQLAIANGKLDSANKALNDSIDKLIGTISPETLATYPPVCQLCLRARAGMMAQIDTFRIQVADLERRDTARVKTIANLNVVVLNRGMEVDSLRSVIIHWPDQPKFLGIIKLNPNQTFIVGVVGGLALHLIVK